MKNATLTDQQMTDVFGRFPKATPSASEPLDAKFSTRTKALLGTATVLLGGAAFAAVNFDRLYNEQGEGPTDSGGTSGGGNNSIQPGGTSKVSTGTITPTAEIEIARGVNESMTFGQAYAAAREEVGTGGVFMWHGEVYNTYTREEWQGLSLGQRQEFLSEVGYRPGKSSEDIKTGSKIPPPPQPRTEPDFFEIMIDGRSALAIDEDHDGIADAIIFMDKDTDDLIAFIDAGGDERIDTVARLDATTLEVIGQEAIEEPFFADIQRLVEMSAVATTEMQDNGIMHVAVDDSMDDDADLYAADDDYVNNAELPDMD